MAKGRAAVNAEYAGLRLACGLVNALPYCCAAALARAAGWTLVRVFAFKRRRTEGRIRSVFPEMSAREVRRVAVRSLQNMLLNAVEMMRAPKLGRRWMDRHVLDGLKYKERLQAYADEGHGVVVMVPHSGNWYMAAWSMAVYGLRLFAIAARQRNPKIDAWMNRQYGAVEVLDRDCRDTLAKIRAGLEAGRVFAILPDLRVRKRDVEADFCGSPVVVAQMVRDGGRHVFNHIATLRPDPSAADPRAEAERITREAMSLIDREVRKRPGDWYWYNKRWILEPPER